MSDVIAHLLQRVQPPRRVRYTRHGHASAFPLPTQRIEERWEGPESDGELQVYRRKTFELSDGAEPKLTEDVSVFFGPDGYGYLGSWRDGDFTAWTPAQIVLPPAPQPGMQWSNTHEKAGEARPRTVELLRCVEHEGCLVSVAHTQREAGAIILRSHFGPDGWQGFEALIQATARPNVRLWTDALSVERGPADAAP